MPATLLVMAVWLSFVAACEAAELDDALATFTKVGPKAEGSAPAAAAWRVVSAAEPAELPKILAALDDASPLAANYIRSAADAVTDRAINAGSPLPAAELEAFVLDLDHAPRARRAAFEYLTRVDPSAPDRLIPGMLDDPGLDFRREAVSRVVDKADEQLAAADRDGARASLEQALAASRDVDQFKAIVTKLGELDVKVDVPKHFGFILDWKLIGPFDNVGGNGFSVAYPPEEKLDLAARVAGKQGEVAWTDHVSTDEYGKIDLNVGLGKASGVAGYAVAQFVSDAERPIELRITSSNALKVWLNGKQIIESAVYHSGSEFDQFAGSGQLKAGKNTILVKLCQNEQTESWAQVWEFSLRACDEIGTAVLSQNRKPTPTAPASPAGQ
jgi:hypothetical protein